MFIHSQCVFTLSPSRKAATLSAYWQAKDEVRTETLFSGQVRPVGDYRAELGESPVWCSQSRSLLWVDILQRRLLRYWPERDAIEQRRLAPLFSAALLTERREQFMLLSDQGILLYHWEDCQAQPALLCPYQRDAAGTPSTRPPSPLMVPCDSAPWTLTNRRPSAAGIGLPRAIPGRSKWPAP
ncbi:SMP-30/gluconolactonase/LRE family protein [Candidatus Sodalis pierantonius]|uniref:SMP-30/gluconolactonase/LRE family protein n=1 Tax=Candidatus Sodalis pierantonii TaxID=1486991 RepID=UPI0009005044|nr:SMP-30/gluconolactonase/LRE family protein [Candidatus Sodalis pierantonius]